MESKGEQVSDIVMVDSTTGLEALDKTAVDDHANRMFEFLDDSPHLTHLKILWENETVKEQMVKRSYAFINYLVNAKMNGKLNANIHNVLCHDDEIASDDLRLEWSKFTNSDFNTYQCTGGHICLLYTSPSPRDS